MYPEPIFIIFGQSITLYGIMIAIGIVACLLLFHMLGRIAGLTADSLDFYELLTIVSIGLGFLSAMVFQWVYNSIEQGGIAEFRGMTFLGGLIGGVTIFVLGVVFVAKPKYQKDFFTVLQNAVPTLCLAHGFGRLGCFFAGCCYGTHTDSYLGVDIIAKNGGIMKDAEGHIIVGHPSVYPTQLYESFLLFAMCAVTLILVMRKIPFNAVIYLITYGLGRFLIELLRDRSPQGEFVPGLSPSQFWCILLMVGGVFLLVLMILYKAKVKLPGILHSFAYNLWHYSCNVRDISTMKTPARLAKASAPKAAPASVPEAETETEPKAEEKPESTENTGN